MPTEAPRPPDVRHQLVFNGEVLRGFDPLTTRCMVQRALKLDAAACAHLFSGHRLVLLQDVPPARASHYIEQFARMGAVLRAEAWVSVPMPGATEAPAAVAAEPTAPRPWGRRRLAYAGATAALTGALLAAGLPGTASPGRAPAAAASVVAEPALAAAKGDAGEPAAARAFAAEYLGASGHKAFAVAAGGSYGWTAGATTAAQAQEAALAACDARREPYAPPCAVIDVDGRTRR